MKFEKKLGMLSKNNLIVIQQSSNSNTLKIT